VIEVKILTEWIDWSENPSRKWTISSRQIKLAKSHKGLHSATGPQKFCCRIFSAYCRTVRSRVSRSTESRDERNHIS